MTPSTSACSTALRSTPSLRGPEDIFVESDIEVMISTMKSVNATAVPA
jgi:hypothetical protein